MGRSRQKEGRKKARRGGGGVVPAGRKGIGIEKLDEEFWGLFEHYPLKRARTALAPGEVLRGCALILWCLPLVQGRPF